MPPNRLRRDTHCEPNDDVRPDVVLPSGTWWITASEGVLGRVGAKLRDERRAVAHCELDDDVRPDLVLPSKTW